MDWSAAVILRDQFSATLGKLYEGAGKGTRALGEMGQAGGQAADFLAGGFGKLAGLAAGGYAAMQAVQFAGELTKVGATAETVSSIFDNLSRSYGINGSALLQGMQSASRGTMDMVSMTQTANRALLAGGAELASELPKLFEIARAAALASGDDINYVFETLVKGIIRGSPLLIDNAGIYIKVGDAVEQYAAKVGKASDELDAHDKMLATLNGVLSEGGAFMDKTGTAAEQSADKVQSLAAAWTDVKRALGEALIAAGAADVAKGMAGAVDAVTMILEGVKPETAAQFPTEHLIASQQRAQAEVNALLKEKLDLETRSNEQQERALARGEAVQPFPVAQLAEYDRLIAQAEAELASINARLTYTRTLTAQWGDAGAGAGHRAATAADKTRDAVKGVSAALASGELYWGNWAAAAERAAADTAGAIRDRAATGADSARWARGNQTYSYMEGYDPVRAYLDRRTEEQRLAEERDRLATESAKHLQTEYERAMDNLRSGAETALLSGLQPTNLDFLQTAAGTYQDAPLESARRLQAIAERGFAELKVHPDWAGLLGIPPEIMAGTEAQLKAWAEGTRQQVVDLTRPDLIDWDAFVRTFAEQQRNAFAKQDTLDLAMTKLGAAGITGGDKLREQVATYFGAADPGAALANKMTGAGGKLLTTLTGELTAGRPLLMTAGTQMGHDLAKSTVEAAKKGFGTVRRELAEAIAPDVWRYIQQQQGTKALQ